MWLRSRFTMSSKSFSPHSSKKSYDPWNPGVPTFQPSSHFLFGNSHSSYASFMTRRPSSSHKAYREGACGLWLVRMALTPSSFNANKRRRQTSGYTSAPNTPASWWIQTPFIFIHSPLRAKPLLGSKVKVRKPVLTSDASICSFPCRTRVLNVYRGGVSNLHHWGCLTLHLVLTTLVGPAG